MRPAITTALVTTGRLCLRWLRPRERRRRERSLGRERKREWERECEREWRWRRRLRRCGRRLPRLCLLLVVVVRLDEDLGLGGGRGAVRRVSLLAGVSGGAGSAGMTWGSLVEAVLVGCTFQGVAFTPLTICIDQDSPSGTD